MSQTDAELRELFEKPKRDAVAVFKDNHDNGDTAIYQFISDIIPLLKARDAAIRIDELLRLNLNHARLGGVSQYYMDAKTYDERHIELRRESDQAKEES